VLRRGLVDLHAGNLTGCDMRKPDKAMLSMV
jgi:hypothetical protein